MLEDLSGEHARRLRDFFVSNGYTERGLQKLFGSAIPPQLAERPKAIFLAREDSVINVLVRLFFLHVPVALETVNAILPEWMIESGVDAKLLAVEGGDAIGKIALVPLADYLFASDPLTIASMSSDSFVLPASSATATYMLNFMLRRPVGSVLDLGTGCGTLAHFASEFSGRVVATDINPRAIDFAAFNAKLNRRNNIGFRTGDLFEPVNGQRFDLIVTNPPFVLAPSMEFVFRDNDMKLDEFCGTLARTAPQYLRDGGCFQMICEWVETGDEPWHERLGRWFEDSNCDVWVLHTVPETPENYAQVRINEASNRAIDEDVAGYAEWLAYYRANDVRAIHSGIITMRQREGDNWIRMQTLSAQVQGAVYDAIEDGFLARDLLDSLADEDELEALTPRLAADAVLEQVYERSDDRWRARKTEISIESGLRDEVRVDQGAVEFLTLFDGTKTISQCIEHLAESRGEDVAEVSERSLPVVRALIERGFLTIDKSLSQPG